MESRKQPLTVFYADDDPDDAYFFELAIKESGWNCAVNTFPTGIDLIHSLQTNGVCPNVIFLDINMPLKNGFECLEEIKAGNACNGVPVYIISTSNSDLMKERAITMGAIGYIEKPSEYNLLKEKLNEALVLSLA